MSADQTPHLSDECLLLLADGELPPRRAEAATGHLRLCATCRARLEKLEMSAADFARAYRRGSREVHDVRDPDSAHATHDIHDKPSDSATRSRDGLKAQIARIHDGPPGPSWISACALLGAALFVFQFMADRSGPAGPGELVRQQGIRPVSYLTPGATRPVTAADLCIRRSVTPRAIPSGVRQAVVRDYSMEYVPVHAYELDYLITPELGGSDDRRNLWPERYSSELWNARVKDELEQLLPTLVCAGTLPLVTAQRDLATDWIAAYKKYFHTDRPLHAYSRVGTPDTDDDRPSDATPNLGPRGMPALRHDSDDN